MDLIINDFEITEDAPATGQGQGGGGGAQGSGGGQAPPKPEDIERIVQHFEERKARLIAD